MGLHVEKEDLIKNKELKNRENSNVNVKGLPLIHVKVKIEHGQGLGSGLGLRVRCRVQDQIKNNEMIKQVIAIPTPGPDVRTKIIDQIYVKRYKKYQCFCWFEHYAKGNSKVQAWPRHTKFPQVQAQRNKMFNPTTCTKTTNVTLMSKDFEDF